MMMMMVAVAMVGGVYLWSNETESYSMQRHINEIVTRESLTFFSNFISIKLHAIATIDF